MTLPGPSVPGRQFLDRHSNPNPNPNPDPNPNPIPNPVQELTVQEVSCNRRLGLATFCFQALTINNLTYLLTYLLTYCVVNVQAVVGRRGGGSDDDGGRSARQRHGGVS